MSLRRISIISMTLLVSACSTPNSKNSSAWESLRESEKYQKEKATYHSRLGDRTICWEMGLDEFLRTNPPKPDPKCIYPASKFESVYGSVGLIKAEVLAQNYKRLKVLQVTPSGFVIKGPNYTNNQVIFVHKTDEEDLVDGAFLDETQGYKFYEYTGPFSYETLAGSRTVYSFKKANDRFKEARKDVKYYDPLRDYLIENKLWENLGQLPKD